MKALIGKKIDMSSLTLKSGVRIPVTRIQAGPVVITAVRTVEKDGYSALQLGFGQGRNLSKPILGHLKNSKVSPQIIREIRLSKLEDTNIGDQFKAAEVFRKGEVVDITGTSKGKGFAGVVKRHGFHGGPKTHGQSDRHRAPGSIGAGTTPGRVLKGKKMAGRMGAERSTVQGLEIISIDGDDLLTVKGAVPGPRGGVVVITKSDKKRKIYHGPQAQAMHEDNEEEKEDSDKDVENTAPSSETTNASNTETSPVVEGQNG